VRGASNKGEPRRNSSPRSTIRWGRCRLSESPLATAPTSARSSRHSPGMTRDKLRSWAPARVGGCDRGRERDQNPRRGVLVITGTLADLRSFRSRSRHNPAPPTRQRPPEGGPRTVSCPRGGDKTAGGCYFLWWWRLLEQNRPLTRLLIRKGSLPGVAPLGLSSDTSGPAGRQRPLGMPFAPHPRGRPLYPRNVFHGGC
jgi:hypothetical protein